MAALVRQASAALRLAPGRCADGTDLGPAMTVRPFVANPVRPGTRRCPDTPDTDARRFEHRRADREAAGGLDRHDENEVKRRFQLAAEGRPDVRDGALLGERTPDREEDLALHRRQRPDEDIGRERMDLQEPHQHAAEQPVLVLGSLRPRRDEVREVVPTGGKGAPGHEAVAVAAVLHERLSPIKVLADVIQEDVETGAVASGCPISSRRVKHDVDVICYARVASEEGANRVVHVLEHNPHCRRYPMLGEACGRSTVRAAWGARWGRSSRQPRPTREPARPESPGGLNVGSCTRNGARSPGLTPPAIVAM